jgi:hypothetical protein
MEEEAPRHISQQEVKEVLDILRSLPDFDALPLPKNIHEEFQIPMTGYITGTMADFYKTHTVRRLTPGAQGETRPPTLDASGNPVIRPLLEAPVIPVETVVHSLEEPESTSAPSTEANNSEHQESPDAASLPALCAD